MSQDHYATLGLKPDASDADIKKAYRQLARKYHPDVSKEPNAEVRFKEVAQAHEALHTPELRAAYDEERSRPPPRAGGRPFHNAHGAQGGFGGGADNGDLFETLFGRAGRRGRSSVVPGEDQHAQVSISLEDAYRGGTHTVTLHVPGTDAQGQRTLQKRQLEVRVPLGAHSGLQLRLAGQGGAGQGGGAAGDLYLEVVLAPHPRFRVEGRDVYVELPLAPWEAALGTTVDVPTPLSSLQLNVPAGSRAGRKLRLKGQGLPATPAGDLYAVLGIALPAADTPEAQAAYTALAQAFPGFAPRAL